MVRPRRRPYSDDQLKKMPCHVCGKPARFQWNACADGNVWRALCAECDVRLNEIVVRFLDPDGWVLKLKAYCKRIKFKWKPRSEQ